MHEPEPGLPTTTTRGKRLESPAVFLSETHNRVDLNCYTFETFAALCRVFRTIYCCYHELKRTCSKEETWS